MAEPFIAQIVMFGGNFAPRGWAFCNGQLLQIAQNTALFSLIGTVYGGDGRTTFALPDMRGRVSIHPGSGPGLTPRTLGQKSGVESVVLNVQEIPNHKHDVKLFAENRPANLTDPTNNMLGSGTFYRAQVAADDVQMNPAGVTELPVGGSQAHTNMQPFLAVNYIIALTGLFPSRN